MSTPRFTAQHLGDTDTARRFVNDLVLLLDTEQEDTAREELATLFPDNPQAAQQVLESARSIWQASLLIHQQENQIGYAIRRHLNSLCGL